MNFIMLINVKVPTIELNLIEDINQDEILNCKTHFVSDIQDGSHGGHIDYL